MALAAAAHSASAEESPAADSPARRSDERRGAYASITQGFDWVYLAVDGHDETGASLSATGLGISNDLLVGHSLVPGFAVGGALSATGAASLALDADGRPANDTDVQLFAIGPFVDVYPKARAGFHFGASLGFAWVRPSMAPNPGTTEAFGGAGSAWAGYDWRVGRDISAGLVGRVSSTFTSGESHGSSITVKSGALTLLATATYF